jgi:hypothetical protein
MSTLTELFTFFGDVIELDFDQWDLRQTQLVLDRHQGWKQYNPRKQNNRQGLSVTSLDGGFSGIPDLDSLLEYNRENNTNLTEADFQCRTSIVNHLPELNPLLDEFNSTLGRCHFLRLNAGGFFPPHRDNGLVVPSRSFRIIVPLTNTGKHHWKWIQQDQILNLEPGRTYCINTTKEHSVFSFVDNCCMLVLNITATEASIKQVAKHVRIR